ncbi:Lrp/AsnC family transcriptional regulator [Asticcacaulis sp. BYS171W]|uniref:Lrp/AsnC family transcriptional regulator n=1 Tax=Asticcacaulis aquaticus TaxID=2984212 RepID=A0ABT5HVL7_9CAUL|nr:Lrp/AsnC family transcriptional regulator [Asticcacaulis aquaticus]MDC7684117.1 Lrp/AsnC family transcriptional regulator [Asticcacaulis aquaticus]
MSLAEPLSSIDIKILAQLQKDASLSTTELADRVGLSQSPCWRRLQRLREDGIIKAEVALLDRHRLGPSVLIFAYLKMSPTPDDKRAEFLRKINATPEILECHALFGEKDIMLKVLAPSMEWYEGFIFNTLLKLPGVTDIQSSVTLTELKSTTALPLRGVMAL